MAVNTHKPGYSTKEVAQIFGCSTQQIFNLIDSKRLGAMITEPSKPNGRRTIRISREHIQEYMKRNPKRFSIAEMRTWGVTIPEEPDSKPVDNRPKPESKISYVSGDLSAPGHIRRTPVGKAEDYPNRPTGAWANLVKPAQLPDVKDPVAPTPTPVAPVVQEAKPQTTAPTIYAVVVNGRIAVTGVSKETAIAISTALLNDTGTATFDDISIQRVRKV